MDELAKTKLRLKLTELLLDNKSDRTYKEKVQVIDDSVKSVVKLFDIPDVVLQSEQLNCKECGVDICGDFGDYCRGCEEVQQY